MLGKIDTCSTRQNADDMLTGLNWLLLMLPIVELLLISKKN